MKLTLGFSPCPNDTFIFDAMIHNKVDTEGVSFEVIMDDVETLNLRAFRKELHITKLSYHAFAYLVNEYALLESGSALGNGVGPLLIAKTLDVKDRINSALIAIPGKYTTANFLCSLAFPEAQNKVEMVFNEIEDAILRGGQIETRATAQSGGTDKRGVDAGVIIHENRFTYQNKGLVKLLDLGEYWETTTGMPIPLGGIVIRRDISLSLQKKIQRILRRSVEFAFKNPESSKNFIAKYAQEMEESVRQQHIDLYVNQYSLELGKTGRAAVKFLFETAYQKKITDTYTSDIFVK